MTRLLAGVLCLLAPGAEPTGPNTLTYWTAIRDAVGTDALTRRFDKPHAVRRDLEARDLEALDTTGVDPELVGFVRQLVSYAQGKAKADEVSRWYHGYWFKAPEVVVEVRRTRDALVTEGARLRTVMAKRYGVDFPPFEFPDW